MDYLTLYLFFKLSAIADIIGTLGFGTMLFGVVLSIIKFFIHDCNEYKPKAIKELKEKFGFDNYSANTDAYEHAVVTNFKKLIHMLVKWIVIGYSCIVLSSLIPTPGEMAAIYLGVQAKNSETLNILSKLPKKYAILIEKEADAYISKELKRLKEPATKK